MYVWPTRKGLDVVGAPYQYKKPAESRLRHIHAVNEVRFWVEERAKKKGDSLEWFSDRDVNFDRNAEGKKHKVDAEVLYNGLKVAVEVELTQKTKTRLKEVFTELSVDYKRVWYFCNRTTHSIIKTFCDDFNKKINPDNSDNSDDSDDSDKPKKPKKPDVFILYRLYDLPS